MACAWEQHSAVLRPLVRAGGVLVCTALLGVTAPLAQQTNEEGGLALNLSFTEQLLWEDGDTSARSDLGLSLTSETRTQRFAISLDAGLEKIATGGLEGRWEDPVAALSYGLENRNSALRLQASYRRSDTDSLVFNEDLSGSTLVLDDGQRETLTTGLGFDFGREARFGGTFSLGYTETGFIDTTNANLLGSTIDTAALGLRFDLDRRIIARLDLDHSDLDRDGGTDVRSQRISVGATMDITKTLIGDIDIGHTRIVRDGDIPRNVDEGVYYRLGVSQDQPNGTISGSVVSDIDENGRRSTARVDRSMELPRAQLAFGFGLSRDNNTDKTRPLYALSYGQDLKRGQISASLDQSFSASNTGQETLNSQFQVSVSRELTSRSLFSGTLSWRDSDVLESSGDDTTQLDLSLNYSQSLTEDWSFVSGYTHSRRMLASGSDDIEDQLFIGLRTAVTWRP